jgi:hypothetical protein
MVRMRSSGAVAVLEVIAAIAPDDKNCVFSIRTLASIGRA